MINTKCPECAAKFFVAENLVTGKVVRFRCRKCGGTITVDGTKNDMQSDEPTEDGADSALLSRVPPAPAEAVSVKIEGAPVTPPKEIKPEKGTLRPSPTGSPVPGGTLQQLAAAAADREPSWSSEATMQSEAKADEPTAAAPAGKAQVPAMAATPKPAGVVAHTPKPAAVKPVVKPTAAKFSPTPKPAPVKPAVTPKPSAVATKLGVVAPSPPAAEPAPAPVPNGAAMDTAPKAAMDTAPKAEAHNDEAPVSSRARLSRISMELQNSVFSVPEDDGVDVPVDMDEAPAFEEVEPEPVSLRGVAPKPGAPKPPAPKPLIKPPPPKVGGVEVAPKPGTMRIELPAPTDASGKPDIKMPGPVPRMPFKPMDDDRVDFASVGRISAEPLSLPSRDILAPVLAPVEEEEDQQQPSPEPAPVSEKKLSPAMAVALPPMLAAPQEPAEVKPSRTGLYAAIAVVAAVALIGGGVFAFRGSDSGPATAPTQTATRVEADDKPVGIATQTAAAPGTGTPAPTAEPTATATAAETVTPAGVKTAEPSTTRTEPTGGSAATPPPPATTAGPAETKPAATTEPPAKPPETKTAETAPPPAPPATAPGASDAPFDKSAASGAMGGARAAAASCKQEGGPQGNASVRVTFAPNGRAMQAVVDGPPFAGTAVGGCIASKFRGIKVPPFGGSPVTVRTTVAIF